jgi:hypothetical protein
MTTIYSPLDLTSNISNGFLVPSASSNTTDAWLAFNSNTSDYWSPSTSTTGEFIQIDLGTSMVVSLVRVLCDTTIATPTAITIAGSSNGTTFTNITAFTGLTFASGVFTNLVVTIPANTTYRHYRLILVNQNGSASRLISVQLGRPSLTTFNKVSIKPSKIKQADLFVDVPYWDTQLERPLKSVDNFATVKLRTTGQITRPTQGQIFPRGYPITSQPITINPLIAPNLTDSSAISVKQITGFGGVTPYLSNLIAACGASYQPTGSFCNKIYKDAQDVIWKHIKADGATWNNFGYTGTGVLVIDLLTLTSFNRACIFQMFDDSKITHIELFSHPSSSNTIPINTDTGWVSIGGEFAIGAGTTGYLGYLPLDGAIVSNPTIFNFNNISSRYLKLHCRNTGVLGGSTYIELGGFKLFNV